MPVYMNSGKIVADGWTGRDGDIEGSTRGPRGPKNQPVYDMLDALPCLLINLVPQFFFFVPHDSKNIDNIEATKFCILKRT